jgi:hypothetical protein
MGNPAKYGAYHVIENGDDFPELATYNVEQGYTATDNVVTFFIANIHLQLVNSFEETMDEWVDSLSQYLVGAGRLAHAGYGVLIVPPECAQMMVDQGWSKADLRKALFERTRRSQAWVKQNGWKIAGRNERGGAVQPGDEDIMLGIAGSPDDIHVVVAGGPAGNFPIFIFPYGPKWNVATMKF